MEIIRGRHSSIFMYVRLFLCVCAYACASAITLIQVLDCYACVGLGHVETEACARSLHASAQALYLQALRGNSVLELQPLLIVLELFNGKPREIWLGGDSCTDNSTLMLAPCHSYLLTPSAPLGADRLIGSYCSTSESEEGKLWPLPCSPASLFHFTPPLLLNSLS